MLLSDKNKYTYYSVPHDCPKNLSNNEDYDFGGSIGEMILNETTQPKNYLYNFIMMIYMLKILHQ